MVVALVKVGHHSHHPLWRKGCANRHSRLGFDVLPTLNVEGEVTDSIRLVLAGAGSPRASVSAWVAAVVWAYRFFQRPNVLL